MKGLIVTGTDTEIGKTMFSAGLTGALARRYGAARYWKPVQAGLEEVTDSEAVQRLAPGARIHPEAYRLITPASPHLAARIDGVEIDPARLTLPEGDAPLVVEGAGGALVPLGGRVLCGPVRGLGPAGGGRAHGAGHDQPYADDGGGVACARGRHCGDRLCRRRA
jgi:dethiobiotin synthetase